MFIPLVACVCMFGFGFLLVIGLTMKTERELIRERVDRYSTIGEVMSTPLHGEFAGSFSQRVIGPFLRKIAVFAQAVTPKGQIESIDAKLETAGRPFRWGVAEFMGLRTISYVGLAIAAYFVWRYVQYDRPGIALLVGLLVFVVGLCLPDYWLQQMINIRQTRIRKALPDTIDLLTVSVEAGVGFDGAMAKVAEKVRGPLTQELVRALDEIRLGKPRMQALRDMSIRVRIPEMSTFVAALYQAEQLGVSIAKVLRVQGDTMRVRRSQMARELASKLPVKMVFPLVFLIFPAIFVILLGPAMMAIYDAMVH